MSDADFDDLLADLEGSVKIQDDEPLIGEASLEVTAPDWAEIMKDAPPPPPLPSVDSSQPKSFESKPPPQPSYSRPPKSGGKTIFYKVEGEKEHKIQSTIRFILTAKDEDESLAPVDGDKLATHLEGPERTKGGVRELGLGRFELSYAPYTLGTYHVHVSIDGKPIFDESPLIIKVVEKFSETVEVLHFIMEGKGLKGAKVGENVHFIVHIEDDKGVRKDVHAHNISVIITNGTDTFNGAVQRTGTGTYKVSYSPKSPGTYSIDVHYQGKSVLSSPAKATFSAVAHASRSVCEGVPSRVSPGSTSQFTIQSKNNLGLTVKIGGDPFSLEVAGPIQAQNLQVMDHNNGQYTVKFVLPSSGTYTFHVKLHGEEISGSPFDIHA